MAAKSLLTLILLFIFLSCDEKPQQGEDQFPTKTSDNTMEISIPEVYELANIILALTDYGIEDPQEIHKGTDYYGEMRKYFAPFKDHPLLKKVNYSRELWADLLSFRTDAAAFDFDANGVIKRNFSFYTNPGHKPFDENLALVNDFAKKSKFREFYKAHREFYQNIIQNYSTYYKICEIKSFLDSITAGEFIADTNLKYKIILSPFVGRMNCHRDLDSLTGADFPNVADALMKGTIKSINKEEQAIDIHTIFTEMDHGYVNPLSEKHASEIERKFKYQKWDYDSGYEGIDCFNEYMTWALYDIFTKKHFPDLANNVNIQWHYQNASRGFFASSLFATELEKLLNENNNLNKCYPLLIKWCEQQQDKLSIPKLVFTTKDSIIRYDPVKSLKISFSEPMKKDFDTIAIYVSELKNGEISNKGELIKITPNQVTWQGNDMLLKFIPEYEEFSLSFNWWGIFPPVFSKKGVMLEAGSSIDYKVGK